ncbi:MAG: FG-GAP-like repeat-containing protein [Planctomycetaceae bacterium]
MSLAASVSPRLVVLRPLLLLLFALLTAGCGPQDSSAQLQDIERQIVRGQLREAQEQLEAIGSTDRAWPTARLQLGRLASKRRDWSAAISYFREVPRDGSASSLAAAQLEAELHMKTCSLTDAAACYEYLVSASPGDDGLKSFLASLLVIGGERARADRLLMELLAAGRISLKDLVMLTQRERQPPETQHLLQCADYSGTDPLTLYALAAVDAEAGDAQSAIRRLQRAVAAHPESLPCQTLLGELLLDASDDQALLDWLQQVPADLQETAGIWYLRGLLARRSGQTEAATRALWEAVRLEPLQRRAMFQLGQLLGPVQPEAATAFQQRADAFLEYSGRMERVLNAAGQDVAGFTLMVSILAESGRVAEAAAWLRMDNNRHGQLQLSPLVQQRLSELPPRSQSRCEPAASLTARFDLSGLPRPDWQQQLADLRRSVAGRTVAGQTQPVQFADVAAAAGLNFNWNTGATGRPGSIRVFESTGGGVAVLDLDLDGRSDLFFTQAEPWPTAADVPRPAPELFDCLYRGGRGNLADVTAMALSDADDSYGQGCCAADFDNDGFPDLYVAGIGRNRLLHNNGDGTFSDVSDVAGLTQSAWTTSCLVLDLNADGQPDLYDVNYLQGESVFRVECGENRCSVLYFDGAPDDVLLADGSGGFRPVPGATPTVTPKGLGIVALALPGEVRPALFIANDQVPNFFLLPNADGTYRDEALPRGLAVNYLGRPTACMGVACGDLNNDGRRDLFVTNFEAEANSLYLQRLDGYFEDAIQGTGLFQPGIPYVGWGTQWLDADNDGDPDLVLANGHVADFGQPGEQYRMPLQFFRNEQGELSVQTAEQCGVVFGVDRLGRALAVLDWNQDGARDFVVGCIGSPAVLAENRSVAGGWLRVQLHGTRSARDASAAAAQLTTGERSVWQFVSAGDGYQCTNERTLHFGLGSETGVSSLRVEWPAGGVQQLQQLTSGVTVQVVEGRDEVYVRPE